MSYDIVIEGRFVDPLNGAYRGFMGIRDRMIDYITESSIT